MDGDVRRYRQFQSTLQLAVVYACAWSSRDAGLLYTAIERTVDRSSVSNSRLLN